LPCGSNTKTDGFFAYVLVTITVFVPLEAARLVATTVCKVRTGDVDVDAEAVETVAGVVDADAGAADAAVEVDAEGEAEGEAGLPASPTA
jgi:hypothetical protein